MTVPTWAVTSTLTAGGGGEGEERDPPPSREEEEGKEVRGGRHTLYSS